ncbi:unnamed protein product [Hymenolepis diminuta]|uniref:ATP synthase subunit epsilon, mitochondrial n=1 Tax=Hymenolepis diminuta TaxID=6216 RepID=A0A564YWP1_HYMDI|nr:unnamed protein product [Hymenolepis diminuta]
MYWRSVGFTYLKYSQLCAKALRSVIKLDSRPAHPVTESQIVKTLWKDGKAIKKQE